MAVSVQRICRYPVKGLSADDLQAASLAPGKGLADDRRFALALAATRIDADAPRWLPKTSFLMLARNERLASLATRFDSSSGTLTVLRDGKQVSTGKITEPLGRAMIGDFFAAYMADDVAGKPRLVEAGPDSAFADVPDRVISIINLASIRDLERVTRATIDPLRFRANIYVDGGTRWEEMDWVDTRLRLGSAGLSVVAPIERCTATHVDPATGQRDMNVLKFLQQGFGHTDMGVYAEVTEPGEVRVGDPLGPA